MSLAETFLGEAKNIDPSEGGHDVSVGVATSIATFGASSYYYLLRDNQGSVLRIIDGSGNVLGTFDYCPTGNAPGDIILSAIAQGEPIQYLGMRFDAGTEMLLSPDGEYCDSNSGNCTQGGDDSADNCLIPFLNLFCSGGGGQPTPTPTPVPTPRIFSSPDPYVAATANAIESAYPGSVLGTNVPVVEAGTGRMLTDFDIETTNYVISVKSGNARHLISSLETYQYYSPKTVIGFTPDLYPTSRKLAVAARLGFTVYTNLADLVSGIGPSP